MYVVCCRSPSLSIEPDRADHRLSPPVLAHQQAGPVQPQGDGPDRLLHLGQGVVPRLLLGQSHGGHRIGHVLDERPGHPPAMVLLQVEDDPARAELGVLVGDHLGEAGGGTGDDAGIPVERAERLAPLGALVDVACDGGDAVGRLILLGELALAGELDGADGEGRAVGVELLQGFLGGDDAGLVESLLDGLLEDEHGGAVGDLDLESERGLGAGDDGGGHGWASRGEGRTLP